MESVFLGTDRELLPQLFSFYAPKAMEVRDVTANTRKMWNGVSIAANVKWYDIDPAVFPDIVASWDKLPDIDSSIDVLIYDPPHLPIAGASLKSSPQMVSDYGLKKSVKGDNIKEMHLPFLLEAKRVLKKDGLIFCKIKDYIHNHRYQWNLQMFNELCLSVGLTPCDLIIKRDPCGGNLKSGRWVNGHHARNTHCYWVIVRNSKKCERSLTTGST